MLLQRRQKFDGDANGRGQCQEMRGSGGDTRCWYTTVFMHLSHCKAVTVGLLTKLNPASVSQYALVFIIERQTGHLYLYVAIFHSLYSTPS